MKIITLSQIGYNHPSQANWSYPIYKVDLIDTKNTYAMSYLIKEAFTSDTQASGILSESINHPVITIKAVYTGTGTPNITGVRSMPSINDKEFIDNVKSFLTK